MTNSFPKAAVLAACEKYGQHLNVDPVLDGVALMKALASNESSLGANCGPRHEPAYDVGGSVFNSSTLQRQLVQDYGAAAASSYGPWQMMFINFDRSLAPATLLTDLDACADNFARWFNTYVIGGRHAVSISDIGQVWNLGHISTTPSPGVAAYVEHLEQAYTLFSTPEQQAA